MRRDIDPSQLPDTSPGNLLSPCDVIGMDATRRAKDEQPWVHQETPAPNLSGLLVGIAALAVFALIGLGGMWFVVSVIEFAARFAQ